MQSWSCFKSLRSAGATSKSMTITDISYDAMWVPDRAIATAIAQSVQASIQAYRSPGGWFDLKADPVVGEVILATVRLYPNASTVT